MTKDAIGDALRSFHRALEPDEEFASAYRMAAYCYVWRKTNGWVNDRVKETAETARLAERASEFGKGDAVALGTGGFAARPCRRRP
jgi:adenylate cyclase